MQFLNGKRTILALLRLPTLAFDVFHGGGTPLMGLSALAAYVGTTALGQRIRSSEQFDIWANDLRKS